jgi:hypothetical protein
MISRARIRSNAAARALLLSLMASGCGDGLTASGAKPHPAPAPLGVELTPLQQQLMLLPVSPEAAAGRPATPADLEEVRSWFGPGELEAVLAIANRNARASGADTLPHCVPLCAPASPSIDP